MTVYSQQAALPGGYNDPAGGPAIPPAITLLFPARDCSATVRLRTSNASVLIGGPDVSGGSWPLPQNQEYVLTLPANEGLYGLYPSSTSNTTPDHAYVVVLVTGLAP